MRLINADNLDITDPDFGSNDFVENCIAECSDELQIDYYDELIELCQKMITGFINIIETEPTAYCVEAVKNALLEKAILVADEYDCESQFEAIPVWEIEDCLRKGIKK